MKNILLIGDSIKKGYDSYVKEAMRNVANVSYHDENCRFSQYILRYLHMWKDDLKLQNVDLVHWNVGHWDTLRIYGDDCLTSPEMYGGNLLRISQRIEFLFPGSIQVFALSTPVIESGYVKDFEMRYNSDVERYNRIAVDVLKPRGIVINDLYTPLKDKPDNFHSDQTHYYTADATEFIGTQVCEIICDELNLDKNKLVTPDKKQFEITSYKNDNELYVKKGDYYELVQGI